jgi:uncharacterized protein
MKQRPLSPRRLDIAAFIDAQGVLEADSPAADLPRLAESLAPDAAAEQFTPIHWRAKGVLRPQRVGPPQQWLSLTADTQLPFTCQRCLRPVVLPVSTDREIRFVGDESVAAQLDADMDEDVLVLARAFDLLSLVEDELIMASPIVPRHDECPEAPVMYVADAGVDEEDEALAAGDGGAQASDPSGEAGEGPPGKRPNPFAVLAQLKKSPTGGDSGGSSGNIPE